MGKMLIAFACLTICFGGCGNKSAKEQDCAQLFAAIERVRSGESKRIFVKWFTEAEQECGVVVEDKDALLLAAARQEVKETRACFRKQAAAINPDGRFVMNGCAQPGFYSGVPGLVCGNRYFLPNINAFEQSKMEIKCLDRLLETQYGVRLINALAAEVPEVGASSFTEEAADQMLYADFEVFRKSICEGAYAVLRDFPPNSINAYTRPKELGEVLNACEIGEEAKRLLALAYGRMADRLLAELRQRKYEFPESRDQVEKLKQLLVDGNLRPDQLGSSEEELKRLTLEDPISFH